MRLSIAQAVGMVADLADARRLPAVGFLPKVDPRLKVAYCPRLHSPPPPRWATGPGRFQGHVHVPGCLPAEPAGHGLVGCAESEPRDVPPRRNGLNGLTATGRRRLTAGCCLLEERRRLLSFWTITLPDEELAQLMELDAWHVFQGHIRRELVRTLQRKGLQPLVLAVAELHPARSVEAGQALPHLHVLFQGKTHAKAGWALSPYQLDRIIIGALGRVGVVVAELPAAGRVEWIRRSVRRYLSKYVSKGTRQSVAGGGLAMLGDPRLCPRQWWFMSAQLLSMIEAATRCLPADFLAWLCDRAKAPWPGAPYVVQRVLIADERAPSVWCISFRSPWALFRSWEAFEMASILGPDPQRPTIRHGSTHTLRDSVEHQQL